MNAFFQSIVILFLSTIYEISELLHITLSVDKLKPYYSVKWHIMDVCFLSIPILLLRTIDENSRLLYTILDVDKLKLYCLVK